MFDNDLSVIKVLISLESVLQLEASEDMKVNEVIDAAIDRLENKFTVTFDRDIYALQSMNQLTADNLSYLLQDLKHSLAELSLYIQLKLFHKNISFTLSDINYLGYSRPQLMTALKYLQDKTLYAQNAANVITPLYDTLNNIPICSTKRLFIVLLMLDRLGVTEGVAIVAQLLYLGGLIS